MACSLCEAVSGARAGTPRPLVAELEESLVLLAETQGCPGWCVVVLKEHREHLELLAPARRARFMDEVAAVGEAMRAALSPLRINYACLCNLVPHLHWHLVPRRAGDPPGAVWSWPEERQRGSVGEAEREALIEAIGREVRGRRGG